MNHKDTEVSLVLQTFSNCYHGVYPTSNNHNSFVPQTTISTFVGVSTVSTFWTFFLSFFNPYTAPDGKLSGLKMHGPCRKQYIFRSCNTSTLKAMRFDKTTFTCLCKKEDKKTHGFQSSHIYSLFFFLFFFLMASWQGRG